MFRILSNFTSLSVEESLRTARDKMTELALWSELAKRPTSQTPTIRMSSTALTQGATRTESCPAALPFPEVRAAGRQVDIRLHDPASVRGRPRREPGLRA